MGIKWIEGNTCSLKKRHLICSDYWEAVVTEGFKLSSRALGNAGLKLCREVGERQPVFKSLLNSTYN